MHSQGIFIVFEGIDGAGKSTQVDRLARSLRERGEAVVVSKEPTDGQHGLKLRSSMQSHRLSLAQELDLFMRDRREHVVTLIEPALRRGCTVILDRYFYSTIAYQGARGADIGAIEAATAEIAPVPDVMFLIDADPELSLARIKEGRKETPNSFEGLENLIACRRIFRDVASRRAECKVVDGHQSPRRIHVAVMDAMLSELDRHRECVPDRECKVSRAGRSGTCAWIRLAESLRAVVAELAPMEGD